MIVREFDAATGTWKLVSTTTVTAYGRISVKYHYLIAEVPE